MKQATKSSSCQNPPKMETFLGASLLLVQPLNADARWVFSKGILNTIFSMCST